MTSRKDSFPLDKQAISFTSAKASGPGGQHVQKTETKVRVEYSLSKDSYLLPEQKDLIRKWFISNKPKNFLQEKDSIVAEDQSTRSRADNLELATQKISRWFKISLTPKKKRIPTKPKISSIQNRLEGKKIHGNVKKLRKKIKY